jgi:hypothetical protein
MKCPNFRGGLDKRAATEDVFSEAGWIREPPLKMYF